MPLRIRRGSRARLDQRAIWLYIASRDPSAADRQIDRMDDAFHLLAEYPEAGWLRIEYAADLRAFPSISI